MDLLLYWIAKGAVRILRLLPLPWVARVGRCFGALAYCIDARHRRVATENLNRCFEAEKSHLEIRRLVREHFCRLGENYCCAMKTAFMSWKELAPYVEFVDTSKLPSPRAADKTHSCIVAIGHFGNFELYARYGEFAPGYRCATTYRALKQPRLNRLLQSMRERSGCLFFERRSEANALKLAFAGNPPLLLGLLADQHAGERGVRVPFFGRECSTTAAPAVLALRYGSRLYTGFCYRAALGRWRIQAGDQIPTHEAGQPRSIEAITLDINRAFETAVRRDPANWFWVHKRWKPFRSSVPKPAAAEDLTANADANNALPLT